MGGSGMDPGTQAEVDRLYDDFERLIHVRRQDEDDLLATYASPRPWWRRMVARMRGIFHGRP